MARTMSTRATPTVEFNPIFSFTGRMARKSLRWLLKLTVCFVVMQIGIIFWNLCTQEDWDGFNGRIFRSDLVSSINCSMYPHLCQLEDEVDGKTPTEIVPPLEERLFSQRVHIPSNTSCQTPRIEAPPTLCKPVSFFCNHSKTFVVHDRPNRQLHVACPGDFQVNFVTREERSTPYKKNVYSKPEVWTSFKGPASINFSSEYADVVCNLASKKQHNYRTQYYPSETKLEGQRAIFREMIDKEPGWMPLTIVSICLDSLSRSQFHRSCGMPKTRELLMKLYSQSSDLPYQAFLFTHLNAVSGYTAMNLTPLYSGTYFSPQDERKRIASLQLAMNNREWMWEYANKRGYITSVGGDTGNGLFGTRHLCDSCTVRPGVLPHWEHGWVKLENQKVAPGVLSGFCDGDNLAFEHVLNFTSDLLRESHPAVWTSVAIKVQHREEQESILQVDEFFEKWLKENLEKRDNIVLHIFGDHGNIYHGEHMSHFGGHLEVLNPFSALILPRKFFANHPEWIANLHHNQDKYVTHYDFHRTIKSLLHFPNIDQVNGHLWDKADNLLTTRISLERGCTEAGMPEYGCLCSKQEPISTSQFGNRQYTRLAYAAVAHINKYHSPIILRRMDIKNKNATTCMDIQFWKFINIVKQTQGDKKAKTPHVMFHLFFESRQGPSIWHAMIEESGKVISVKQKSRYAKHEFCKDPRVSIEFCVCRQFPDDVL